MELIYDEEEQLYFTVPDGDIATHKQIHEYYNIKTLVETKIYNDENCTKIIEEIEHSHIPHLY